MNPNILSFIDKLLRSSISLENCLIVPDRYIENNSLRCYIGKKKYNIHKLIFQYYNDKEINKHYLQCGKVDCISNEHIKQYKCQICSENDVMNDKSYICECCFEYQIEKNIKICKGCKVQKPWNEFWKASGALHNLSGNCKLCYSATNFKRFCIFEYFMKQLILSALGRSRKSDRECFDNFELNFEFMSKLWNKQYGLCSLTGIK